MKCYDLTCIKVKFQNKFLTDSKFSLSKLLEPSLSHLHQKLVEEQIYVYLVVLVVFQLIVVIEAYHLNDFLLKERSAVEVKIMSSLDHVHHL